MINLPKLILASGSPRRAEILTAVGWQFTKQVADIDESLRHAETPENYVQRLAKEKAEAVAALYENALVLGADTTVVINGEIIGKPVDLDDARAMLKKLSGNRHEVLTGVALVKVQSPKSKVQSLETVVGIQRTRVKFAAMQDAEIEFLVEKGEPLDKAGAYAVQAQAALFIEGIEGDYWNVVGLPVRLVYELMRKMEL
ncbi:MAG TPA: Maf family protein [Pyrinomonadaceae bacterium]|jgi:septum formation protein